MPQKWANQWKILENAIKETRRGYCEATRNYSKKHDAGRFRIRNNRSTQIAETKYAKYNMQAQDVYPFLPKGKTEISLGSIVHNGIMF